MASTERMALGDGPVVEDQAHPARSPHQGDPGTLAVGIEGPDVDAGRALVQRAPMPAAKSGLARGGSRSGKCIPGMISTVLTDQPPFGRDLPFPDAGG
jgi:hypothetical protein